jgi:hypothetical protein
LILQHKGRELDLRPPRWEPCAVCVEKLLFSALLLEQRIQQLPRNHIGKLRIAIQPE